MKLQIVGLSEGYDEAVVRIDEKNGRCLSIFYFREGRLIAVDAVNKPVEFMGQANV